MARAIPTLFVASLVAVLVLAVESFARPAAEEPPLELQLHVAGAVHALELDKPLVVQIDGEPVELKVTAAPSRLFDNAKGLSFRYPSGMGFEYDDSEEGVELWTLDGSTCVLLCIRYADATATPAAAQESMVEQFVAQFGAESSKVSSTTLDLGGTKRGGTRVDLALAGSALRVDVVGFHAGGAVHLLVVQDQPVDGGPSPETKAALDLLARTFRTTP